MAEDTQSTVDPELQRVYEVGFHLIPTLSEDKTQAEFSAIKSTIETHGGAIVSEGAPTLIDLAYTMVHKQESRHDKYDNASFGWVKFEAGSQAVNEIKDELRGRSQILRFIVVKTLPGDTLSGETIFGREEEEGGEAAEGDVSDEELDKHIDTLVGEEEKAPEKTTASESTEETEADTSESESDEEQKTA